MNIEIINKLDEITSIIENDKENIELNELKDSILMDNDLLNKIKKVKEINEYSSEYVQLKKEVLNDERFKNYKEKEKDLNLIISQINSKLNSFREKSGCK